MNVTTATTRTHTVSFSVDDITPAMTATAIKALGLTDSTMPATVRITDGWVCVEVVEQVADAAPATDTAPKAATPPTPASEAAPGTPAAGGPGLHFPKA